MRQLEQRLYECVAMKNKRLVYKKGGKCKFDDIVNRLINLTETAKEINEKASREWEYVAMHPECYGSDFHQNQESLDYCGKCLAYSEKIRKKAKQKEENRAIYRV